MAENISYSLFGRKDKRKSKKELVRKIMMKIKTTGKLGLGMDKCPLRNYKGIGIKKNKFKNCHKHCFWLSYYYYSNVYHSFLFKSFCLRTINSICDEILF